MTRSIADIIRSVKRRLGKAPRLTCEVPNSATRRAMRALETGAGKTYPNTAAMLKDFGI